MKYIRKFPTVADYNSATIYQPSVSLITATNGLVYDPLEIMPNYLTFEAAESNCHIKFVCLGDEASNVKTIEVSSDGNTWTEVTSKMFDGHQDPTDNYYDIAVLSNIGDKLYLRGNNSSYSTASDDGQANIFLLLNQTYVYGNIMSLIQSVGFENLTSVGDHAFKALFLSSTGLLSHPTNSLILPATSVGIHSYDNMFQGCTSLTTAPELPATTLSDSCYYCMFYGCESLTTVPELPVTTLAERCYREMFSRCTSLTTAPELPATTLANSCYYQMFYACTSLTTAPELPATTLAIDCYSAMFSSCSSLITAPASLPATTLVEDCYNGMFSNCTSLTTAPVLPATTLANYCYGHMFARCTSLNNVTMLATDISATDCLSAWVHDVASTGIFTKSPQMTTLPTGISGIPSGWTVQDYVG